MSVRIGQSQIYSLVFCSIFLLLDQTSNIPKRFEANSIEEIHGKDSNAYDNNNNNGNGNDVFAHAYLTPANYNYTWIGNHWYSPMGAPDLLAQDIRRLFQSENTLWLGDSTCRQDFYTMYHMINSQTPDNVRVYSLESDINRGKRQHKSSFEYFCPARSVPKNASIKFAELGQVLGTDQNCSVVAVDDDDDDDDDDSLSSWSRFSLEHQNTGKFDLLKRSTCYHDMVNILTNHTDLLQRKYTTLVLSLGIWESEKQDVCAQKFGIASWDVLVDLLDLLHQMSGPSLFVVWKTHGLSESSRRRWRKLSQNLTEITRRWFSEKRPEHMDLADFELAVNARQYGEDRIAGDLQAHFGLEARLLSIDLMSRAVTAKQKRNATQTQTRFYSTHKT